MQPSFRHLIVIYNRIYYKWQGLLPSTSSWATYGHVLYLSGLHFFFNITNTTLIVRKFLISGDVASNTEKRIKGCWLAGGVGVAKVSLMWVYQKMGLSFLPIAAFLNTFQCLKYLLWKESLMLARWGIVTTSVCLLWIACKYLQLPIIVGHCLSLGRMMWWPMACLLNPIHHHDLLISPLLAKCLAYKTYSTHVYQYFQNKREQELF